MLVDLVTAKRALAPAHALVAAYFTDLEADVGVVFNTFRFDAELFQRFIGMRPINKRVKPPSDQLMQSYASLRPRAMTRGLAGSGDANDARRVPQVQHDGL